MTIARAQATYVAHHQSDHRAGITGETQSRSAQAQYYTASSQRIIGSIRHHTAKSQRLAATSRDTAESTTAHISNHGVQWLLLRVYDMQVYDATHTRPVHGVFHFHPHDEEAENHGMAVREMLQSELMVVGRLLDLLLALVGSSGCNFIDTQRLVANHIAIIAR